MWIIDGNRLKILHIYIHYKQIRKKGIYGTESKIYSGFRSCDGIERIDEINGTAYEMKHENLVARLIYIDYPDT